MRKVKIATAGTPTQNEGRKYNATFTDTNETAGYLAGWSGEYIAVRLNGEKKTFAKQKDARNFLETQIIEEPVMIGRKVIARAEGKRPTKSQRKAWGI